MAHTPGPWSAKRTAVFAPDCYAPHEKQKVAECFRHLEGGFMCATIDEAEANARLIAAAPDLIDALILARNILCGVMMEPDRESSLHAEWRQGLTSIDAAIAMAQAEQVAA